MTSSTVSGYLGEQWDLLLPVETVDDDITTARVKKEVMDRQLLEK